MRHYGASTSQKDDTNESPGRRRKGRTTTPKRKEVKRERLPSPEIIVHEEEEEEEEDIDAEIDSSEGDDSTSVQKYVEKLSQGLGLVPSPSTPKSSRKRKLTKKDSDSSSEEERWLDAIKSGKLDEVDEELKKVKSKDPKLMTARQRAMLERKGDKEPPEQHLMSLPSGYKEVVMTAEAIQRKAIKSQKRKEKADEKREKDKKKTMERLLKKQESKTMRGGGKKGSKRSGPTITYICGEEGVSINLPPGVRFPLEAATVKQPPAIVLCKGPGCKNPKKFNCSKTSVPLCSLNCYKQNIDTLISSVFS